MIAATSSVPFYLPLSPSSAISTSSLPLLSTEIEVYSISPTRLLLIIVSVQRIFSFLLYKSVENFYLLRQIQYFVFLYNFEYGLSFSFHLLHVNSYTISLLQNFFVIKLSRVLAGVSLNTNRFQMSFN